jgi:hypothetical protein
VVLTVLVSSMTVRGGVIAGSLIRTVVCGGVNGFTAVVWVMQCMYCDNWSGRVVGGPMVFDGDGVSPILAQADTVGVPHHGGGYGSRSPPETVRLPGRLLSCPTNG